MLPKRSRLSAAEVRSIIKTGNSLRVSGISTKFVRASGTRAAIVVSARVARKATERNRLRRAAYGAVASLPAGVHAVFFIERRDADLDGLHTLCSKLSS